MSFALIFFFQQLDQLSAAHKKAEEEFQAREKAALGRAESAEGALTLPHIEQIRSPYRDLDLSGQIDPVI